MKLNVKIQSLAKIFIDILVEGGLAVTVAASSRQREFHPKPLTEPYVIVSHHTALVIHKC
jgi:hypothetical protein